MIFSERNLRTLVPLLLGNLIFQKNHLINNLFHGLHTVKLRQFELEGTTFKIRIGEVFKLAKFWIYIFFVENLTKNSGKKSKILLKTRRIFSSILDEAVSRSRGRRFESRRR